MKFKENVTVVTADHSKAGRLDQLVIDPQTNEVTDVIVRTRALISKEHKVVPINMIESTSEEEIRLRTNAGDLGELPDFEDEYYVPLTGENRKKLGYESPLPVLISYYPYAIPGQPPLPSYIKETEKNIPEDTVALEIGASVISVDGDHVGDIETVLTDSASDRVTHFVIALGMLVKERRLVPATWVSHIEEDKVNLAVDTELLNKLPEWEE